MKKYLFLAILGFTLTVSPVRADTLTAEQRTSIQAVIQSLLLQVAELVKQLQAQIAQQTTLTTQMQQIIQNQAQTPSPVFGSVEQINVIPEIKKEIDFKITPFDRTVTLDTTPKVGYYSEIQASYKENGIDKISDFVFTTSDGTTKTFKNGTNFSCGVGNCVSTFDFMPKSTGFMNITINAGGISTTTIIEVK